MTKQRRTTFVYSVLTHFVFLDFELTST